VQVSRSIGDVYMKHAQFNREPINPKFRLPEPMHMPILSANPSILSHPLHPNDSFLIFASDGLWEHLNNDQAVEIVHRSPRAVRVFTLFFVILNAPICALLVLSFLIFSLYYCRFFSLTPLNSSIDSTI
jgi:hypothetical protein